MLAVKKSACFLSAVALLSSAALAAEGSSIAGPIGGTDIRSAHLPPPGLNGGSIFLYAVAEGFFRPRSEPVEQLGALDLARIRIAPFLVYKPEWRPLGGSIGIGGTVPFGTECGRLFAATPKRCKAGLGEPYVELAWSRFFGEARPSGDPGAPFVPEGLAVQLGLGAVLPLGAYDAATAAGQGLVLGNNVWDIAPFAALTYTSAPFLADGTEISVKSYWNNYLANHETGYQTGLIVGTDFAISERFGRVQLGLAGLHVVQIEDDRAAGVAVPPDGRRMEGLSLGPVLAYDLPEIGLSFKLKALTSVISRNSVGSFGVAVGWVKRF